ncbi:MAG: hypothetical protein NTZ09_14995 [Candidatus Hydrogenedentes bacterium]|nr:hypothetical protein [Candidatus Hydrogenedentota bacterium]
MGSDSNPDDGAETIESWMARALAAKRIRRRELARLPFEEKIKIVVQLQRITTEIRTSMGLPARKPWDLPDQ